MNWFQWLGWGLLPVALIMGWVTPGLWRRIKARATKPFIAKIQDVRAWLVALRDSGETDAAKLKAEIDKIINRIEQVLPWAK